MLAHKKTVDIHSWGGMSEPTEDFICDAKKMCGKMIGASGHQTNEAASQQL